MVSYIPPALLAISGLATAATMQGRAESTQFGMYAYGPGVGGFPVFNVDYLAYVGLPALAQNSTTGNTTGQDVYFTISDGSINAFPNSTLNGTAGGLPGGGATFFTPTTAGGQLGFVNGSSSSSGIITTGWRFYGNVLLVDVDGTLVSPFSVMPTSADGVWILNWNDTSDNAEAIPVTIKNAPPSTPPPAPSGAAQ